MAAENVAHDDLALIRIEGMHCHRCELAIQKALTAKPGVREVEVDFASGQASVLFDKDRTSVEQLVETINEAGYRATDFSLNSRALK